MNKKTTLSLILGFLFLLSWQWLYKFDCIVLVVPLAVSMLITNGISEYSIKKKTCMANCYFITNSFWFKFIKSRKVIYPISIIKSLVLTISLLASITLWEAKEMLVFASDVVFLYWFYFYLLNKTHLSIKDSMKYTIIKNTTVWVNTFIIVVVLAIVSYNSTVPEYMSEDLNSTVYNASKLVYSECTSINTVSKFNAELQAMGWSAMINASQVLDNNEYKMIIWILFLLSGSLNALAFGRYTTEIISQSIKNDYTNKEDLNVRE